jgi:acyl-CoA synthetase (AMP-forming)/AMP-acid ligase II
VSPAIEVAKKLGVRVDRSGATLERAGRFLAGAARDAGSAGPGTSGRSPIRTTSRMVLHTSGTTSRPKIVPLTQRNVSASATNIRSTLAFSGADRGLNIMPLFHIHGLIAGMHGAAVGRGVGVLHARLRCPEVLLLDG